MKKILLLLLTIALTPIYAQFIFQREINLTKPIDHWFVDPVGNIYILEGNKVSKLDSLGKLTYSQAIKSQGEINQLVFNSAQKIISFSEEQQQICIFDNTITPISACISLDDFGISNATCIASSSRANAVWLYDRVNSTLFQLDTDKKVINQQLRNIAGLVGFSGNTTYLKEDNEQLWISDGKSSFAFDLNLNYLEKIELPLSSTAFISKDTFFEFREDVFFVMNISSKEQGIGENPVPNAENISLSNGYFFFKKGNKLFVYRLA